MSHVDTLDLHSPEMTDVERRHFSQMRSHLLVELYEAEEDWNIVHGTVWSEDLGKRIEHAWCEREGFVVEMTLPEAHRVIAKETYYRTTKPEVRKIYSGEEARDLALKHRHDGPWDKDE